MRRALVALALWAAPAAVGAVQSGATGPGTEGSIVVSLPASARSAALGGAGAALVGDAGSLFANPAGIATAGRLALEASYQPYLAGSRVSSAALALKVGRFHWGVGAHILDYGSEDEVRPDGTGRRGTPTGQTFRAYDLVGVTGLVYRLGLIAVGVSGKYVQLQVADVGAHAWAGDAGLAIAVFDLMALGVSVQNLGGDFGNGYHLPQRTRAGFTMNYTDPQGVFRLLTTLELQWPEGRKTAFVTGVEGGLVTAGVGLVSRVGYVSHPEDAEASNVTLGGGIAFGHLRLDYAYQGFGAAAAATHRVGIRWTP